MTIRVKMNDNVFYNPDNLPLEDLKLATKNDGVVKTVNALDKHWAENRTLSFYTPPPDEDTSPLGALQSWKDSIEWFIDDLKWLLSLEHYKFWSNIVHNPSCMNMLVSFLQEAYPPYVASHKNTTVMNLYNEAYKKVFIIFSRLITNKESQDKWLSNAYMSELIYDNYIFTIPVMWDLCLIYGTTNSTHIKKLIKSVFHLQPKYYNDLGIAIDFVKKIYEFITSRLNNKPTMLPATFKGFNKNFGGLRSNAVISTETMNARMLEDFVLHVLDSAVTIRIFMEAHPQAKINFREKDFHMSVVNCYENGVTRMYEKAQELFGSDNSNADKIYSYLDTLRVEFIDIFRFSIETIIEDILAGSQIEENINTYLTVITDSLSEKCFIRDYNSAHPIENDFDVLCQVYPEMDPIKCEFILEAVMSNYDVAPPKKKKPEYSTVVENGYEARAETPPHAPQTVDIPEEAKTQSLISEVKDILPHLGDGYVLKCLQFYSMDSARVINCILEGNLDASLQKLDTQLPIIPEETTTDLYKKTGIERLNVFDFDEFDVMNRDDVNRSKIHKGKKKFEHKNLTAMLDDKSYVKEVKDKYVKYSVVSDEDEYDDTYDDPEHNIVSEASAEIERNPNKRKTFKETEQCLDESDEDDNEGPSSARPKDQFCVNPEEVRARYQANRNMKYGKQPEKDVVGKAKGQGQEKDVLLNRQKKEAGKSSRANHNRRSGAQWKKSQGMIH